MARNRFIRWAGRVVCLAVICGLATVLAVHLLAMSEPATLAAPARAALVLHDVHVVDPRGPGRVSARQTVVIAQGRIVYMGMASAAPVPADARVIRTRGKYLIPGLWDSHVHTLRMSPQLHFPLMIAYGVTSARDLGDACAWSSSTQCRADLPAWRSGIGAGRLVGPRLHGTASHHLEDLPENPAALTRHLAALRRRGDTVLKLQLDDSTTTQAFDATARAGMAAGFRVAAHLPLSVDLLQVGARLDSIEHDNSLLPQCARQPMTYQGRNEEKPALLLALDPARCARVVSALAREGIAYVPTHVAASGQDLAFAHGRREAAVSAADRYIVAPQRWLWALMRNAGVVDVDDQPTIARYHDAALALTARAHRAGVVVLAGTDSLDADVVHGLALHRELEYLVSAGLTPAQALASATTLPARHFGQASVLGTVAPGQLADLVLLDANPLADVRNTRRIHAVIADGRWYGPRERRDAIDHVAARAGSLAVASRYLRGLWYDAGPR